MTPPAPRSRRPASLRSVALVAILAGALILAACAQTPSQPDPDPDPQAATVAGIVQIPPAGIDDPDVVVVAASLLMLDMPIPVVPDDDDGLILLERLQTAIERASVDASMVAPASVVEIGEGAYLAGVALVQTDGGFELVLPDGADIPEPLFRAAAEAIPLSMYVDGADCTLVASDPDALVTLTFWQFTSSATLVFYTQLGLALSFSATEEVDFESPGLEAMTLVTLAYATAPTTLSSTGTECATEAGSIAVDVPLVEGWNQVTWSFTETTFTVGARAVDATVYSVPLPIAF